MIEPQDQGTSFGTWGDDVSRLMYRDSVPEWIEALALNTSHTWLDLGGANGLLRPWFPHLVTVDYDATKEPDVVADLRTDPLPDVTRLGVIRYVLHYLDDEEVRHILRTLNLDTLVVVQFVNANVEAKRANSRHEGPRYFRSLTDLVTLLVTDTGWEPGPQWSSAPYRVDGQFYAQRLGGSPDDYTSHTEAIHAIALRRTTSTKESR